ncbi:bifunctional nuclease family protein [bacterium]|nr:MAG: bifunctional nuclease family protein [bacterium]
MELQVLGFSLAGRNSLMALIEMTVEGIGIDPSNNPLVLLRDAERKVFVPIWIGPAEAVSIQMELNAQSPQRPMTHDLMVNLLKQLNATLVRVTVNEFSESVYYASLHLQSERSGVTHEIDARPSDAIALALRTQAQILVSDEVAQKAGILVEESSPLALTSSNPEEVPLADDSGELDKLSRLLEGVDLGDDAR